MRFRFQASDGSVIERDYPIGKCPAQVRVAGKRYCRSFDQGFTINCKRDVHFVSHQIKRWHPDAPAHDEKGRPLFASRSEAVRFADKNDMAYDEL